MLQSMGSERAGHNVETEQQRQHISITLSCYYSLLTLCDMFICSFPPEYKLHEERGILLFSASSVAHNGCQIGIWQMNGWNVRKNSLIRLVFLPSFKHQNNLRPLLQAMNHFYSEQSRQAPTLKPHSVLFAMQLKARDLFHFLPYVSWFSNGVFNSSKHAKQVQTLCWAAPLILPWEFSHKAGQGY